MYYCVSSKATRLIGENSIKKILIYEQASQAIWYNLKNLYITRSRVHQNIIQVIQNPRKHIFWTEKWTI